MKFKNNRLLLLVIFLLVLASSSILIYLLTFATAINQEKDTAEIIKTAILMELTRSNTSVVDSNQQRLLVRSFPSLTTYLEQHGWTWADQMGAMVLYNKEKRCLNAKCQMYSRNYMICNLNQVP
ncbi:hypothetical protein NIES4071_21800 [Calothrix sp. NIES-4071]|nr:hypothetical protein NIES4071_21800 [Calothrix sp. NIES-4071]BAZ56512.1 hypothetical protein NIES4105_21750 [Calothrix sp. NIES-4105]